MFGLTFAVWELDASCSMLADAYPAVCTRFPIVANFFGRANLLLLSLFLLYVRMHLTFAVLELDHMLAHAC